MSVNQNNETESIKVNDIVLANEKNASFVIVQGFFFSNGCFTNASESNDRSFQGDARDIGKGPTVRKMV